MTQTIIGVFPSLDQANAAMTAFASNGLVDKQHMRLSANDNADGYGYNGEATESGTIVAPTYPNAQTENQPHTGILANIESFFAHLFGSDNRPDSAVHYHEAVRRGSTLLAVDVEDETQISAVEDELTRAGAVDIEAQVARWQTDGYIGQAREPVTPATDRALQARDTYPGVNVGAQSIGGVTPASNGVISNNDPVKTPEI
jgi:hypothetical protein